MKRLLLIASMLFSVAYGQVCADEDTVRSNSATLITANSARINGTTTHFTGAVTSLQLKYVRVGQTDTVTSTGATALRNITGLQAATAYYYYYKTICGSGTRSQTIGAYTFTTLANTILYAPERPTVFNHLKVDSSFIVPEGDTVVGREPSSRSQIRYKTSDNTFYGYYPNCTCWRALAIDSSGIIALLDGKVDSVTVSGDSLFYWKVGVSYGYILPATLLNDLNANMVYVDITNGSDITGTIGNESKPYQTLEAAKTDATAGYTIVVRPGNYTVSSSLAKDSVDWFFYPGATVTMAYDTDSTAIFDDGGSAKRFVVKGAGKFTRSTTDDFLKINVVNVSNASSNITIEADEMITNAGTDGIASVVRQSAGTVNINSRLITVTGGNSYAVWWINGSMFINSSKILSEYSCIFSEVDGVPTGDCNVEAFEIEGSVAIGNIGTDDSAAIWVHANIVRGKIQSAGLNKVYVNCQKVFGAVEMSSVSSGLMYVTTDKITDVGDGVIYVNGGVLRLNVNHIDPDSYNGDMTVLAGQLQLNGADYTASSSSDGFVISGGTALLTDCNFNTSANSGTSPITKSGGTLTIRNNILTGESTVNGISAPTSQTVISYGSVSNRPLDSDVVLSGNITANSLSYNSNIASGVGTKVLRYNPTTEQITYADTSDLTASSTTTFTNKRWTARVGSTTSSATPTINTDNVDVYKLTAQAAAITSFSSNLSGTPADGDILEIQITDNGTARAITWGASFVSTTVTLPTTTTISTTLTVIFQYYTTSSYGNNKWHCVNYY